MPATNRRSLDFRTFDELSADVARLQSGGYAQLGQWSLEQILDHLTRTIIMAMDGAHGLPRPMRWLLRPIGNRMLRKRSMPTMPAPKSLRPPPAVDARVYERFAAIVAQSAGLSGPTIEHPAFGRMSVEDWQQLQLIHASRHLSFLIPRGG